MPHENAFEGNLADPVARKKLKPRYPHIGKLPNMAAPSAFKNTNTPANSG
jgi:hypothetical protein